MATTTTTMSFETLSAACDWLRANGFTYCAPMSRWFAADDDRGLETYRAGVTRRWRLR